MSTSGGDGTERSFDNDAPQLSRRVVTTGDGSTRASSPYRPAICGQSVAAQLAARACTAALAAWMT